MDTVNDVLSKVMSKLGFDRRLKEHTFASLWPTFVSGALADRSRPLFIDAERNLVVSVANAATGQELSMLKSRLLPKLVPAARALGIEIKGLRLDMKHYHAGASEPAAPMQVDLPLRRPNANQLLEVKLSGDDVKQLEQLSQELESRNDQPPEFCQRLKRLFETELRLRRWQLEQGFPVCKRCGNPAERLHRPLAGAAADQIPELCLACLYV